MKTDVKAVFGIAIGLAGVVYGVYSQHKMNKIAAKLNIAIEELSEKTPVEVSEEVVAVATEKAIDREVCIVAHKAALACSAEMASTVRKEVRQTIDVEFVKLSEQVSDEIANQVANIDKEALSNKVTRKAEQKILDKFDGSLDDVLDKFNGELKNVSKIYSSIADAMSKRDESKANYFKF